MNFKDIVINEILSFNNVKKSFLSAIFKTLGSIELKNRGAVCILTTDNLKIAEKMGDVVKELYLLNVEFERTKVKSGVKRGDNLFIVKMPVGLTKDILADLCIMSLEGDSFSSFIRGIPEQMVESTDEAKSYLRGLFVGSGSVYVPSEGHNGYHIEFQVNDEKEANDIQNLLSRFGLSFKVNVRGANFSVYAKDKNILSDFLTKLSLVDSAFELNKIIVDRDLNNSINRNVICEAANLDKTFTASAKQIVAIENLHKGVGLDSLPLPLKTVALARMENPTATLNELAENLGISKSCLNHRLRRIIEISEDNNE